MRRLHLDVAARGVVLIGGPSGCLPDTSHAVRTADAILAVVTSGAAWWRLMSNHVTREQAADPNRPQRTAPAHSRFKASTVATPLMFDPRVEPGYKVTRRLFTWTVNIPGYVEKDVLDHEPPPGGPARHHSEDRISGPHRM